MNKTYFYINPPPLPLSPSPPLPLSPSPPLPLSPSSDLQLHLKSNMSSSSAGANINYILRNCLLFAYKCLRNTERLVQDSLQSPYEKFYDDLAKALSIGKKFEISVPNSEVEAFYTKRFAEKDFITNMHSRIFHAGGSGGVVGNTCSTTQSQSNTGVPTTCMNTFNQLAPLYALVWEMLSKQNAEICCQLPLNSGQQLWEMFLQLDGGKLM